MGPLTSGDEQRCPLDLYKCRGMAYNGLVRHDRAPYTHGIFIRLRLLRSHGLVLRQPCTHSTNYCPYSSGRSGRLRPHAAPLDHVVGLSQRNHGLYHGSYNVLLSRRRDRGSQNRNRLPLYPGLL